MPGYTHSAQTALLKAVRIVFALPSASSSSPLTAHALQANRVFEPKRTAESLDELTDGVVLGYILHELDSDFDPTELESNPGTSRYLTNKRNIQNVYKGLFRFIRRQVPELGCQAKKFDYHAIADNPEPQGISQLLAVMLSAAAMGPDNQKFVPRLQSGLDKQTQAEIMQVIRTVQQDINNSKGDDDLDEAIDAVMEARDIDLLVEEQNAALRQQLDICKKNLSDYITRLDHLQQSHEELKYEKEKNDRELEVLRKATQDGANSAEAIKSLEAQIHEQMEIIARHEETIRRDERIKAQLESEVQKLMQKCYEAEELRDQATEWKHKAEDLEKKANTAERYKQKLESQQHLVKEVQNLQYEKGELQDQIRSLMDDRERGARTRKAEDELTKMITQSEQHLWDERSQKNQLMKDIAALEDEVIRLRARQSHDENFIKDLQDQLQTGSSSQGALPSGLGITSSLEDELNDAVAEDGQVNLPLELSRLKAENDLLRSTVGSGDTAPLRRELDEEKKQRAHLQRSYNDLFEKHAVAHDQIDALVNNMTGEGLVKAIEEANAPDGTHVLTGEFYRTKAFINLRAELMQAQFELEQSKKREKDLSVQVADQGRDLLAARSQLSALDKEGVDALKELKSTDVVIISSLKSELDHVREELSYAISERDAQKTQLVEALLAKDKLRKEVEEGRDLQDVNPSEGDATDGGKSRELIGRLRTRLVEIREVSPFYEAIVFGDDLDQAVLEDGTRACLSDKDSCPSIQNLIGNGMDYPKLERSSSWPAPDPPVVESPNAAISQLERSETDKIDLQRKLKAANDGEAVAAQKAASDQIIRNLERENALIATAWYDLTSRLQSNHVVLQRRHDAPRSWLNKQRQMVNGQLRFRDSLYLY
ncbi:hook3 [Fusarium albosuccineum]|uniref:Hook3 n=1 Tax=Fusarium albosuccineum TaxID=1237068 RepID=A0A8H4LAT9_9HYPO|nr:hook3 [Fusarium albosuccineum]